MTNVPTVFKRWETRRRVKQFLVTTITSNEELEKKTKVFVNNNKRILIHKKPTHKFQMQISNILK